LILAFGTVTSVHIAARILYQDATLQAFRYDIVAFVILQFFLVLGPLCVFAPRLLALKRRGRRDYGMLGARYTREFDERWMGGAARPDQPLLGSSDIQSLADLANSFTVVEGMRAVPFGRDTVIRVAVVALAPFAPLLLAVVPAEEIVKRLLRGSAVAGGSSRT
jgi:hypothetical protein